MIPILNAWKLNDSYAEPIEMNDCYTEPMKNVKDIQSKDVCCNEVVQQLIFK